MYILKLLVITREFPPKIIGGLGYHLGYLYREIAKNHEVTVIAGECAEQLYEQECPTPKEVDLQWVKYGSIKGYQIRFPIMLMKKLRDVNISKFDVAITHTEIPFEFNIPTISQHHDSKQSSRQYTRQNKGPFYKLAGSLINPYRKWIDQKTLNSADYHIFISNVCKNGWMSNYKIVSPSSVLYNGVDRGIFYPRDVENDGTILFVGDSKRKGVSQVLDFAYDTDTTVRIVGNVDSDVENVECVGRISREKLVEYYSRASVTIHPANFEAFGSVVLESLSCGTPVVVSENCGAGEILTEETGAVTDDIKQGVEYCRGLDAGACVKLSKNYTWSKVANRTVDIAQQLI